MAVSLQVASGRNSGQEIVVRGRRFLIGRAADCQLRAHSEQISRYHCALLIEPGKVFIRDYGSRNGTLLDGERVLDRRELRDGQQLQIGPLEFKVCIRLEPADPASKDTALAKSGSDTVHARSNAAARRSASEANAGRGDTSVKQAAQSLHDAPGPLDVMQFLTEPPAADAQRKGRSQEPLPDLDEFLAAEQAAAKKAAADAGETPPEPSAPAEEGTSDAAAEGLKRLFKPKQS